MGGVFSVFLDLLSLLPELSASTGFAIDAILAGEAAATVEAQVAGLMLMESIGPLEALASIGLTAESFSLLSAMPGFFNEAIGLGVVFQTVSGVSSLVSAGIRLNQEVSVVNRHMALVPWIPHDLYDIYFPGVSTFSYSLNVIGEWASSLIQAVGRNIWESLIRESRQQIGHATSALAQRGARSFHDALARVAENARWVITNGPVEAYRGLERYYQELPGLNPAQFRQLQRRMNENFYDRLTMEQSRESGEVIDKHNEGAPGGARQRVTPDWMLPLVLGLYGDITPTWSANLAEEDVPKKKRRGR
ncbi:VP2 [California sea lion polyomavirus 2]|nr:VP2 [California sea lion polyomavirus 2]